MPYFFAVFGIAAWFIYALAILAAANVLAISTLSQWVATAVSYLPALIAGLLVIVIGFVVADFIGDAIMRTRAATHTAYTRWFYTLMTQPTNSPTDTTELCQHCLQETPHSVRIEIRTENEGSENAALSREPYRITECQECETATDQRMNSI